MRNQEFISFIENLALVKDVELKSKLIQDELSNLNKLLKAEKILDQHHDLIKLL